MNQRSKVRRPAREVRDERKEKEEDGRTTAG